MMSGDDLLLEAEGKMEQALNAFLEKCKGIRTGRASSDMVENIKVDYYGAATPLKQLAAIQIPDASLIVIKPFDASVLKEIEKTLCAIPDFGITPQNDGKLLRLPIPPMSQDRRKKYADMAKGIAEEARVALRNVRRDAKKDVDLGKKEGTFPEDDATRLHDEIQRLTDEYGAKVEAALARKTEELLKL